MERFWWFTASVLSAARDPAMDGDQIIDHSVRSWSALPDRAPPEINVKQTGGDQTW